MEENWIMTDRDEYDYNALSVEDKNIIFEDLNKMVYRFNGKEKKMIKASFCHRWKPESAVAYKLMVRTHQKVASLLRIPDEQLTEFQIATGKIWNGDKVQWMCDHTNEAVEEIQDMYQNLLESKEMMTLADHYDKISEVRREEELVRGALKDEINKLTQALEYKEMSVKAAQRNLQEFKDKFYDKVNMPE